MTAKRLRGDGVWDFSTKYGLISLSSAMPRYDRFGALEMASDAIASVHCCVGREARNAVLAYGDPVDGPQLSDVHSVMILGFRPFTSPENQGKYKFGMYVEGVDVETCDDPGEIKKGKKAFRIYSDNPGKVLRSVVQVENLASSQDLFQAACHALAILEKGLWVSLPELRPRGPPVYLQVWDAVRWFYGILEVDGFVWVEGGKVTEESLSHFPEETAEPIGKNFTPSCTRDDIQGMFSVWKRRNKIADGWHPVGKLFFCNKSFRLPRYAPEDSELSLGANRFYEGNLKVLVGRKVRNWTAKDVIKTWLGGMEEGKQLHKEANAPSWIQKVLYPGDELSQDHACG